MVATRSSEQSGTRAWRSWSRRCCSSALARVMALGSSKTTTTCAAAWMASLSWYDKTRTYPWNVSTSLGMAFIMTLPSMTVRVCARLTPTSVRTSSRRLTFVKAPANLSRNTAFAPLGPPPSPMPRTHER